MIRYLKPDEAAAVLTVAPKTLANWRRAGFGPLWIRARGGIRYLEAEIIAWMQAGRSHPKMPIRVRPSGKLEWRFEVDVHVYSKTTGLEDIKRNRSKAQRVEAKMRELVLDGGASELHLQVQPFDSAAEQFIEWCKGEYRDHSNSWERLRTSMTGAKIFFWTPTIIVDCRCR